MVGHGVQQTRLLTELLNASLFSSREPGTSVDKKYDGECKKEITTVSELCDEGPRFRPVDVRGSTASVWSSNQTSRSYRSVTAAVLQHKEDFAFSTRNTHYPC